MKKTFYLLLFIIVSTLASAQKTDSLLTKNGYSIVIPTGWRIAPECKDQNCSLYSSGDTLNGPDTYIENLNITVDKLPSASYTVDQYAAFGIQYLPKVVKDFKLLSKKKINTRTYVIEYQGIKSKYNQSWWQYYYVKNAKVYIVTLATETIKYAVYKKQVEATMKSFRLF